ncbi:MAG: Thiol:disulfide interchange protein DsbD precursor [Deltaproteobacteria bacterium ADurb.Bin510]|nr:MAG: Thiol:disulfide interchange protein DsbD precursor [Deltaproteobacteria bacterium ADurb.Bin510]
MTVAYIGAAGQGSRLKGFALSLTYVLGTAVTYTALGLLAALSGSLFGRLQTSPVANILFANVCLLMGLSLLDVFYLPSSERLSRLIPKGQGLTGSFLLGLGSGLLLGPCTAPVLSVLLAYAATGQNPLLGMALLFCFALGLGSLLLIVGSFTGLLTSLPRSGAWLVRIKRGCGWLLLLLSEYFLITAGKYLI